MLLARGMSNGVLLSQPRINTLGSNGSKDMKEKDHSSIKSNKSTSKKYIRLLLPLHQLFLRAV
jgi:hypothetical protein